jgi:glutathione peroxidase
MKTLVTFLLTLCATMSLRAADAKLAEIPFKTIDGKETSLKSFAGKTVLAVNVASKCGFTRQYKGLEELYQKYKDKGLVIIGFPSNDFGGQEPGTNAEIKEFCSSKFNVTFPLMDKISVKGDAQHPLYKALTGPEAAFPGDVKWNFGKFLIGKDGKPLARYGSTTAPDDSDLVKAIEADLAKK